MSGVDRERAQLVLAAAAVVAVALAPAVLAYLQLGAHPDVRASEGYDDPGGNAERLLTRAVHDAGTNVTGEYGWSERDAAARATRTALDGRVRALESSRVASGTAYTVTENGSAAAAVANDACPRDPTSGRAFGPCEADGGLVLQDRAGETTLLAAAFDVRVTTAASDRRVTLVVWVVPPRV